MLRRLGIRGKVLAALSVPVLVLFILAGTVSLEALREVQTSRTVATLLSSGGDSPVITKKPEGAWSHAVVDAKM